jgi:hypothetical protein
MLFNVTKYRRLNNGKWSATKEWNLTAPDWTRAIRSVDSARFISPHGSGTLFNRDGKLINDTESRVIAGTRWVSKPIYIQDQNQIDQCKFEVELVSRYIN